MNSALEEFDTVVLTHDLPSVHLRTGDIGAIVHRYPPGGYEVEFVAGGGDTVAVLTRRTQTSDPWPLAKSCTRDPSASRVVQIDPLFG